MTNATQPTKAPRPRRFAREAAEGATSNSSTADAPETTDAPPAPRDTKISKVLDLLRREEGATIAELIAVTGWLPHTTRAALTGLKKKGHVIEKTKRDDVTCYRIVVAA